MRYLKLVLIIIIILVLVALLHINNPALSTKVIFKFGFENQKKEK